MSSTTDPTFTIETPVAMEKICASIGENALLPSMGWSSVHKNHRWQEGN
ncbi:hypothetical protein [Vibrio sp. WXL103]